jgi:hypothetical protein
MKSNSLRQIEEATSNGFHDARLFGFSVDLIKAQAKIRSRQAFSHAYTSQLELSS